jgi:hypothetical protein
MHSRFEGQGFEAREHTGAATTTHGSHARFRSCYDSKQGRAVKFEQRGERWTQPAGHIKCTHAAMAGRMCRALVQLPMALLVVSAAHASLLSPSSPSRGQVPVIARSSRSRPASAPQGVLKSTFFALSLLISVSGSLAMPVSHATQTSHAWHSLQSLAMVIVARKVGIAVQTSHA